MKIRRMGLRFAPKNREFKINDSFSIDEVCEYLEKYLNDEIQLLNNFEHNGKRKARKRAKKKTDRPPIDKTQGFNEEQVLIICASVIGYRVIRKYCKGERPHWQRVAIWRKSLSIMDYFEKTGSLATKGIRFYLKDGYLFLCRIYGDVDGIGMVILPETKPCRFSELILSTDSGIDAPGPFYDMPPLLDSMGVIGKKDAARKISEFVISNSD